MVKSVFKWLGLSIIIPIFAMLLVEMANIAMNAPKFKSLAQLTLQQSCQYFAQETYKTDTSGFVGNAHQLVGAGGQRDGALDGNFYHATSSQQAYDKLYRSSPEFSRFYTAVARNKWKRLDLLAYEFGFSGAPQPVPSDASMAKYYSDAMLTPLNIGVAYLDRETVKDIFRWEFVAALTNDRQEMIQVVGNNSADNYALFSGMRIYYNTIKVTGIDYKVYDLRNQFDKKRFKELTNMDADTLAAGMSGNDERNYVIVATLNYSMRVGYEGLTPIKRIFKWAMNVYYNNDRSTEDTSQYVSVGRRGSSWDDSFEDRDKDTTLSKAGARNEDASENRGDNFNNIGDKTYSSRVVYYIIR